MKSISTSAIASKALFEKYELIANDLEEQRKESEKALITATKHRTKDNIDRHIRKEIAKERKQKLAQKTDDPFLNELEYYDLSLPELLTADNLSKPKTIEANTVNSKSCLQKYDETTQQLIESELSLIDTNNSAMTVMDNGYNAMFDDLIPNNHSSYSTQLTLDRPKELTQREIIKSIDWSKLENYIEFHGWNKFAQFLNETESENAIETYSIPSFLATVPKRRLTRNRPKAKFLGSEEEAFKYYRINQKVQFEPFKFLSNGNVAVLIDDKHYGFIKGHNLPIKVEIGEYHSGFVYDVSHFGKLEVVMESPNFWSRMCDCQRRIINVLRYCNGSVDFNDKSDPRLIRKVFQMSKKNFKKAIGMLLKNRMIEIFNDSDADIPQKIILKYNKMQLERYDVGKKVEERMWKNRPIWEYGLTAPVFHDLLPQEMKDRKKKSTETYEQKFALRKTHK